VDDGLPMADCVLDTHACVFALAAPAKLGTRAKKILQACERGAGIAWIPAAVAAEIIILRELRRISIGLPELSSAMRQSQALRFLPLDLKQLDEFAAHQTIRDPFDRLILSAARVVGGKLITRDERLSESGLLETVWD
jgi:PIN domain nuclease of toxin-antitoxin system